MPVVYSVVERFDPDCGERWEDYIRWSGLTHLREVVSLDILLCPTVVHELTAEDWEHNIQADFLLHLRAGCRYRQSGRGNTTSRPTFFCTCSTTSATPPDGPVGTTA